MNQFEQTVEQATELENDIRGVLTQESMPRGVPTFDVLPLEQACEHFDFARHPPASQFDFCFGEDPKIKGRSAKLFRHLEKLGLGETNQLGFARAGS